MAFTEIPLVNSAVDWQRVGRREWDDLQPRTKTAAKLGVLALTTLAAYHYSLSSLLRTLGSDSPLAFLGLVPAIAVGLAWVHRRPRGNEPPIHDRQLDYTTGIPLVGMALVAAFLLPTRLGAMAWVNRLDLLFFPMFVIGATILLFGVRVAWRQKVALGFLFLAWPWPYTTILLGTLNGFRSATLAGIGALLHVVPVATPVGGSASAGLFQVVHGGSAFPISIVTACSGAESMIGFLLVGIALVSVVRGSLVRRLSWLAAGIALCWVLNLVRLMLIFGVGHLAGSDLALNVLHPAAGFVFFALAMIGAIAALPLFGLRLPVNTGDTSGTRRPPERQALPAVPRVFLVTALLATAAVLIAGGNTRLRYFDPVASASGEPRLSSYLVRPAAPAGWTPAFQTEYVTSKALFGRSSRWYRYLYSPTDTAHAALRSALPVTADVIDARGLGGFETYGITACYSFHGYKLREVDAVKLGNGITGQTLSYAGRDAQDWSIVWWIWPVRTGDGTRYERVVLSLQNTTAAKVDAPAGTTIPRGADALERRLVVNRAFLVGFGRAIVAGQAHAHDFDVKVTTVATPGSERAAWAAKNAPATTTPAGVAPATVSGAPSNAGFWQQYRRHHPAKPVGPAGQQ